MEITGAFAAWQRALREHQESEHRLVQAQQAGDEAAVETLADTTAELKQRADALLADAEVLLRRKNSAH